MYCQMKLSSVFIKCQFCKLHYRQMEVGLMMTLNVSKLMNADQNKLEAGNFKQRPNLNSVRCLYQVWEGTVRKSTGWSVRDSRVGWWRIESVAVVRCVLFIFHYFRFMFEVVCKVASWRLYCGINFALSWAVMEIIFVNSNTKYFLCINTFHNDKFCI